MARLLLPFNTLPLTKRCPCCNAPVNEKGNYDRWPGVYRDGYPWGGMAGTAIDALPVEPDEESL